MSAFLGRNGKRRLGLIILALTLIALLVIFTEGTINWDDLATGVILVGVGVMLSMSIALFYGGRGAEA